MRKSIAVFFAVCLAASTVLAANSITIRESSVLPGEEIHIDFTTNAADFTTAGLNIRIRNQTTGAFIIDAASYSGGSVPTNGTVSYTVPSSFPIGDTLVAQLYHAINYAMASDTIVVGVTPTEESTENVDITGIANAQIATAERVLRLQTTNIRNRLRGIRANRGTGRTQDSFNFVMNDSSRNKSVGQGSVSSNSAVASFGSSTANASPWDNRNATFSSRTWSMWGESSLSTGHDHKNGNNDFTTYAVTLGVDRFFTQCFAAGIAIGYTHDKTDVGKNGSESKGNAYTAGLYGSYSLPSGFFIDGSAGYSYLDLDSHRYNDTGFADGDRNGNQYFASLESGYDIRWCNFLFTPYGRADASHTRLNSYTERGANAYRYDSTNVNLFSLSAGVRGEYAIAQCWGNLIPSAGVEYTHNFRDTLNQKMGEAGTGTMPYLLRSKGLATNQFTATAGLRAEFRNGWGVGGEYQGTYASDRAEHGFFLRVSKDW